MTYKGYQLISERGYITIKKNDIFVSSADNVNEAYKDIDEISNA